MEKYNVKFLTPGHLIIYRNRRFRTPVLFENVLKSEIGFLDSQARRSMVKYEVSKVSDKKKTETLIEELELDKEDEDIEVEELDDNAQPSTILEKLIAEDKEV